MKKILINMIGWLLMFIGCVIVAELDMTVRTKVIKFLMALNDIVANNALVWSIILATVMWIGIRVILRLMRNARGHIG